MDTSDVKAEGRDETRLQADDRAGARRKHLLWVLLIIFVFSAALLAVLWRIGPAQNTIPYEVAKTVLQVGLGATVVTAIGVVVFDYQRDREKSDRDREAKLRDENDSIRELQRTRDEILRSWAIQIRESYNSIKIARRLLIAKGTFMFPSVTFGQPVDRKKLLYGERYDDCMMTINKVQIELENLASHVISNSKKFHAVAILKENIRNMERYLGHINGEYEKFRGQFSGDPDSIELARLSVIESFWSNSKERGSFKEMFSAPFHKIEQELLAEQERPLPE